MSDLAERDSPGENPAHTLVLYVMGAGRSGSTTLGIALGNCRDLFFAGELDNWLPRSGTPQVEEPERLRFWENVRSRLRDPAGAEQLYGHDAQQALERSLSLLRVHKWPLRGRLRRRYRAVAADVYGATAAAAGTQGVVDTSHYPLRALELQRAERIDLFLLFLVRRPQSVVASFKRRDVSEFRKSALHANVYLWITHALSLIVFLRHPRQRRLLVHYEDFIADPGTVIQRILEASGCADTAPPDFGSLKIGVPLQGNRITRSVQISLKTGTDRAPGGAPLTGLLQAPMMLALSRLRPTTEARRDGKQNEREAALARP